MQHEDLIVVEVEEGFVVSGARGPGFFGVAPTRDEALRRYREGVARLSPLPRSAPLGESLKHAAWPVGVARAALLGGAPGEAFFDAGASAAVISRISA